MTPQTDEEERAFRRLYGDWQPMGIEEVKAFFTGYDHPWWVVGGHAVEAQGPPGQAEGRADLDAAWPLLDAVQRGWLLDAVRRERPDHPWLDRLEATPPARP